MPCQNLSLEFQVKAAKKFVSMIPSLHDQHLLLVDFRAGKLEALLNEADALL